MADLNLAPERWDWPSVTTGDTYPAANIVIAGAESTLSRVRIKFRACGATSAALTLDSDTSGITINDAATWDFTIDAIPAVGLAAGIYSYDMETTSAAGTIATETQGTWEILPEITD
jgi:hypothetical protein